MEVDVDTANALLTANYVPSPHPDTGSTVYTTNSYSIPSELEGHLAFVYPTTRCVQCWIKEIVCHLLTPSLQCLTSHCQQSFSNQDQLAQALSQNAVQESRDFLFLRHNNDSAVPPGDL